VKSRTKELKLESLISCSECVKHDKMTIQMMVPHFDLISTICILENN